MDYSQSFIQSQAANDQTSTWSKKTKIANKFYTYDMNKNVNGVIFNLTTNDKKSGYMRYFVNPKNYNIDLVEFGYDGEYLIEGKTLDHFNNRTKIISLGSLDYYININDEIFTVDKSSKLDNKTHEIQELIESNYK